MLSLAVVAFLVAVDPFLPNCGVHAAIVDYGVYKVEARITNYGPSIIDSKTPGLWSTDANSFVSDSYGPVSASWSIHPLTANEAQVNIDMSEYTYGSINVYRGDAGQAGEVHFNYHSDTPFTVNYYWDFTWDIYPFNNFDFNWFAQQVRLRIRDDQGNELYPSGTFPPRLEPIPTVDTIPGQPRSILGQAIGSSSSPAAALQPDGPGMGVSIMQCISGFRRWVQTYRR